jgi:hypothetical protein
MKVDIDVDIGWILLMEKVAEAMPDLIASKDYPMFYKDSDRKKAFELLVAIERSYMKGNGDD